MTGNKYTYESVKKSFEDEGYTLISNTYLNTKTNLEYICNKHKDKGTQKIKYAAFIDGSRCPYCSFENGKYCNPVSNEIKQYATERLGLKFVKACTQDQKSEVYFICPKHEDKGIQHSPWASIRLKKNVCGYCNGFVRSTEDFENLIHEKLPYIKIIGQYSGAKKRVRSLCTVHNYEWEPKAYNLLSGYGCPICGNNKIGDKKRIDPNTKLNLLIEKHPDIDYLSVPRLSSDYVRCRCKTCMKEWSATYTNLVKENYTNCPFCHISIGEKRIGEILDRWGYSYEQQKTFDDCKNIRKLPFDFYLPDFNTCIEYQGEQHYKSIEYFGGDESFKHRQRIDSVKNEYCSKNNIPLIHVPYWEFDDLEYFLFDQFVRKGLIIETTKAG